MDLLKGSTTLASNSDLNSVQTVSITSDGSVDLGANGVTLNDAVDVTLAGAGSVKLGNVGTTGTGHGVSHRGEWTCRWPPTYWKYSI